MVPNESSHSFAKRITLDAFAEAGVKLREDDPVILVAAVLRRVLMEFREDLSKERQSFSHAVLTDTAARLDAFEKELGEAASELGQRFRADLRSEVQTVNLAAERAVERAVQSGSGDKVNRYRIQGAVVGALVVLVAVFVGALIRGWWH